MFRNIILLIFSVIVAFCILETILNYINYQYLPIKIIAMNKAVNKSDWRQHHILDTNSFKYDPYLIWRPKKGNSVFNREGYRGRELNIYRDKNTYCIFAFGDSNTLGMPGKDVSNWPGKLDSIIINSGDNAIVVNAGVWGYTLF